MGGKGGVFRGRGMVEELAEMLLPAADALSFSGEDVASLILD